MPANNPPSSRTSSISSATSAAEQQQYISNNAALRGATLAFGRRQPPQPGTKPKIIGGNAGNNGAMVAATTVGRAAARSPNRPVPKGPPPTSVAAVRSGDTARPVALIQKKPAATGTTHQDRLASQLEAAAHSQQAAMLAAARAKPTVPAEKPQETTRMVHRPYPRANPEMSRERPPATEATDKPTDSTPIAPTTSLVHMFEERSRSAASSVRPSDSAVPTPSKDVPLRSPKPIRSGGITSMFQLELEPDKEKRGELVDSVLKSNTETANQFDGQARSSPSDRLRSHTESQRRPQASPSRHVANEWQPTAASQFQPPRPMSAQSTGRSISSMHSYMSIPAQYNAAYPRKSTPLRSGDQLANALVASSLASSRAPSPTRLEPPPVPQRRRKGHSHKFSFSRTPSPPKTGMLQTLRKQDSSSSEAEDVDHPYKKHHKKHLVRKHPHKHHEGDRKRWRDVVTERERKRYEGVWAANRGLYCCFTPAEEDFYKQQPRSEKTLDARAALADGVSNIVVRDIWKRSRLPVNVLELVWALVDSDQVGRLCKEEFVVGMWLIDQRLKGRKLPSKVSESVWASVRSIGIKIRR